MQPILLPAILPIACVWVARQERWILRKGTPLSAAQLEDAYRLGIVAPQRIRLLHVSEVPLPGAMLADVASRITGQPWNQTAALSARYGIYIREDLRQDRHLLAHELVHTRQYERLGGIRPFLQRYLCECLTVGYEAAPLELEAEEAASAL